MKVGIVTYALNIGGIERVILNLYQGFQNYGFEPTVIEVVKKGEWSDKFQSMGLRVERILPRAWESKKSHALRVLKELKRFQLLFLNDVQYVHSILGLLPSSTRVFPIVHGNLDCMLYNASFNISQIQSIFCVNPILADRLVKEYGVKREQIHVVPNALDTNSETKSFSSREKDFVYLGRLNDFEKGIMDIPEFFKIISTKYPQVRLDIYGSGLQEEELKDKIREFELQEIIRLKGELDPDRVYEVLSEYKFLIFPSKFESGALVLKEAMTNGLIPFAYRLKGQTDVIVTHGQDGFLAEPGNINEFASNVLTIYGDSEKMNEMSDKAIQAIQDKFSLQKMMKAYTSIIEAALKSPEPSRSSKLEIEILEEYPSLPIFFFRPLRKALTIIGFNK